MINLIFHYLFGSYLVFFAIFYFYSLYICNISSDIIINNFHKTYNGLTIELKTPNGKGITHEKQHAFMNMSSINGHKVLLSNDYDEILTEIINYMRDTRLLCVYCSRMFKNVNSLNNHHKYIHRISNI